MKSCFIIVCAVLFFSNRVVGQNHGNGVTDVDGNKYKSVIIGTQEWMEDNLRVSKYRNGQPIPFVSDSTVWNNWNSGAYCHYRNDKNHGVLYNWFAVIDVRKICPLGWHIPSVKEWDLLAQTLGGDSIAGGKMKAKLHWEFPNTGATNESGFHALPKGSYGVNGSFNGIHKNAYWWSSTENGELSAWGREVGFNENLLYSGHGDKRDGLSVRCLKD